MKTSPQKVQMAAQKNTNDADVALYSGPQLSEPSRRPTKAAASIRAILLRETKNKIDSILNSHHLIQYQKFIYRNARFSWVDTSVI